MCYALNWCLEVLADWLHPKLVEALEPVYHYQKEELTLDQEIERYEQSCAARYHMRNNRTWGNNYWRRYSVLQELKKKRDNPAYVVDYSEYN